MGKTVSPAVLHVVPPICGKCLLEVQSDTHMGGSNQMVIWHGEQRGHHSFISFTPKSAMHNKLTHTYLFDHFFGAIECEPHNHSIESGERGVHEWSKPPLQAKAKPHHREGDRDRDRPLGNLS